jgi:tryptophan synthase alpha chain
MSTTSALTGVLPGPMEQAFRDKRADGRKLLVPFVTGGVTEDWVDVVRACAAAGADAIEIGIPFSDPVMDGPVIQRASVAALNRGVTPLSILADLRGADIGVPLVAMTSFNIAFRMGANRFASLLADGGFSGTILPDLPLDEADVWMNRAIEYKLENVLLAAPTTPDDRMARICAHSRGWVYGIGTMGVTGERATLADSALVIARRLKACTDLPVLVGIGVSNAEQAEEVAAVSDGVIVGAAVVRRILEGEGPEGVRQFVATLRDGVDRSARSN